MKVIIRVLQQEFGIDVSDQEPVIEIKRKIEQHLGIPMALQTLSVSEWELLDGLDMEDYPIVAEGTKIDLSVTTLFDQHDDQCCLTFVLQTSSSLLGAAKIPVQMSDSSTVSDLRHLLLSRKTLPFDDYLFVHRQKIMRNGRSLRWHGVEDGDFLYVFKGAVSRGEF